VVFFSTAPFDAQELDALTTQGATAGDLLRVVAGTAIIERASIAEIIDLATWINLRDLDEDEVTSLGEVPTLRGTSAPQRSAREVLSGMTQESAKAFNSAFEGALGSLGLPSPSLAQRAVGALRTLFTWMKASATHATSGFVVVQKEDASPLTLRRVGWLDRVLQWLDGALGEARLASLFGHAWGKHVDAMLKRFEEGDIMTALRMAIPLGDGLGDSTQRTPLGLPGMRDRFEVTLGASPRGGVTGTPGLYEKLQALYRNAIERLEREGRIEEAAWIVAELLRDPGGAVALLERHERFARAAELAEAAGLPDATIARLWALADDLPRAVRHARHGRCFDAVIAPLTTSRPALATELRREWAELLARSGDVARAVEVVWPFEALRPLARPWIDEALAQGGAVAARMLARKASTMPERYDDVLAVVAKLCNDDTRLGATQREHLASALLAEPVTPETRALGALLARTLIEDGACTRLPNAQHRVRTLLKHLHNDALRIDLPSWAEPAPVSLALVTTALKYTVAAGDVGARPVFDAAMLPDARCCIALGEAGLLFVGRDGRTRHMLDVPCEVLVMSDHGDRCLALARRGRRWRVTRVDLVRRTATPWAECFVDAFARSYDGDTWVVAVGDEVFPVDALDERIEALRASVRVERTTRIMALARTEQRVAALTLAQSAELWSWELSTWTLRARKSFELTNNDALQHIDATGNGYLAQHNTRWSVSMVAAQRRALAFAADEPALDTPTWYGGDAHGAWVVASVIDARGARVRLFDATSFIVRAALTLDGATAVHTRIHDTHLVVCDDRGRVLVVELGHGFVTHDLRT
jgi:hypothetical protein